MKDAYTPEETKITINNPYPFVLGDINAHVDRVLRDTGNAGSEIHKLAYAAIMTCHEPGIHKEWMNRFAALTAEVAQLREENAAIRSPHWQFASKRVEELKATVISQAATIEAMREALEYADHYVQGKAMTHRHVSEMKTKITAALSRSAKPTGE